MWRVRFHDERCLYLVLHLEFQSTVDRAMAVRMLAYTTLLYQKLIGEGVLREQGDEELTQAFRSWVEQVLLPRRFRGGGLGEPLSGDRFPQPFQEPFELGHSFSELPELLGRLLSLGVDPVSKLSDLRVYPVAQPAVVTRRDPPHAEQYCCDHAHGGQHDRDDSSALHLSLGTLVVVGAGVNAGVSSSRRPAAAGTNGQPGTVDDHAGTEVGHR